MVVGAVGLRTVRISHNSIVYWFSTSGPFVFHLKSNNMDFRLTGNSNCECACVWMCVFALWWTGECFVSVTLSWIRRDRKWIKGGMENSFISRLNRFSQHSVQLRFQIIMSVLPTPLKTSSMWIESENLEGGRKCNWSPALGLINPGRNQLYQVVFGDQLKWVHWPRTGWVWKWCQMSPAIPS